jgi:hypothetical protein
VSDSSAPTGPRGVATGEAPAAVWRAVRNPWKRSCFNTSAPTGRRNVATGGAPAAVWRAVRNPWKRSCFNTSAPKGRRNRRAARRISRTHTARRTQRRARAAFAEVRT